MSGYGGGVDKTKAEGRGLSGHSSRLWIPAVPESWYLWRLYLYITGGWSWSGRWRPAADKKQEYDSLCL